MAPVLTQWPPTNDTKKYPAVTIVSLLLLWFTIVVCHFTTRWQPMTLLYFVWARVPGLVSCS